MTCIVCVEGLVAGGRVTSSRMESENEVSEVFVSGADVVRHVDKGREEGWELGEWVSEDLNLNLDKV